MRQSSLIPRTALLVRVWAGERDATGELAQDVHVSRQRFLGIRTGLASCLESKVESSKGLASRAYRANTGFACSTLRVREYDDTLRLVEINITAPRYYGR